MAGTWVKDKWTVQFTRELDLVLGAMVAQHQGEMEVISGGYVLRHGIQTMLGSLAMGEWTKW